MLRADITEYYRRGGERDRLAAGEGRLEYLRTMDVLTRTLPDPPAAILDVGGATGVYARPLASMGYRVCVVDPLLEHVTQAGADTGLSAVAGDARGLPIAAGSADAVLALGPFYHLLDREDRILAWREAARVLRPGGVVVAATISRFASLFDGLVKGFFDDPRYTPLVERALVTGKHENVDPTRTWFASAYFHHPVEAAAEASEAGLAVLRLVAVETPMFLAGARLDEILASATQTEQLLNLLRRVEDEPSLLGGSAHLLTIAAAP